MQIIERGGKSNNVLQINLRIENEEKKKKKKNIVAFQWFLFRKFIYFL